MGNTNKMDTVYNFPDFKLKAALIAWLVLFGALFLPTFLTPVQAQGGIIQVTQNTAKVSYQNGVEFRLNTNVTGGQPGINRAQLKVKFGTRGREETYDPPVNNGYVAHFLGEDEAQLVTGMALVYTWTLSTGNVQYTTNGQTVLYEDPRHVWAQREGPKVTVRWHSADEQYGRFMYQLAADSLGTYKRRFSFDPQDHIYVTIYANRAAFFNAFPNVPRWAGGFARYGGQEIVVISPQNQGEGVLAGEGIPHELSHAALFQFLRRPAPVWLDEGLAVYNQNTIDIKDYDATVMSAYRANALIPFDKLNSRFPGDEGSIKLAYGQSRRFVTFLINSYGDAVWRNLLDALRRRDADGAFMEVFGVDLETMEELWKSKDLGGNGSLKLPAALKAGPVSSQANETISREIPATGTVTPTASGNPIWLITGLICAIAGLTAFAVGFVVVRRRRPPPMPIPSAADSAAMSRLSVYGTGDSYAPPPPVNPNPYGSAPGNYYSQGQYPPAPNYYQPSAPAAPQYPAYYQPQPSTPMPTPNYNYYQPQTPKPPASTPVNPTPADDPFDLIFAKFGNSQPNPAPQSPPAPKPPASFFDNDPYGLFEPDTKKKPDNP
jgi:hypothetical protein